MAFYLFLFWVPTHQKMGLNKTLSSKLLENHPSSHFSQPPSLFCSPRTMRMQGINILSIGYYNNQHWQPPNCAIASPLLKSLSYQDLSTEDLNNFACLNCYCANPWTTCLNCAIAHPWTPVPGPHPCFNLTFTENNWRPEKQMNKETYRGFCF